MLLTSAALCMALFDDAKAAAAANSQPQQHSRQACATWLAHHITRCTAHTSLSRLLATETHTQRRPENPKPMLKTWTLQDREQLLGRDVVGKNLNTSKHQRQLSRHHFCGGAAVQAKCPTFDNSPQHVPAATAQSFLVRCGGSPLWHQSWPRSVRRRQSACKRYTLRTRARHTNTTCSTPCAAQGNKLTVEGSEEPDAYVCVRALSALNSVAQRYAAAGEQRLSLSHTECSRHSSDDKAKQACHANFTVVWQALGNAGQKAHSS